MKLNDYELVELAHEGNEEAINLLYQKYRPLMIKKSKEAILLADHHGIEINDIVQECYIAFDEAIKNFNQDGDATFYTFSMMCVERRIANYIRKITGNRGKILNEAITIDDGLQNFVTDNSNPYIRHVDSDELMILKDDLSFLEKKVFNLRVSGYSFLEIAKLLNKDTKAIYNAWERIKVKYRKNNENDN